MRLINLRTSCALLLLLLALSIAGLRLSEHVAYGQTCSSTNTAQVNKKGWTKGQTVTVYIDPAIQGDARRAIEQAFNNWNAANQSNNSNVSYTFSTTAPTSGTYFTVSYASQVTTSSGTPVRALTSTTSDSSDVTTSAATRLDQRMTNYDAVLETMSHEIGHPAGFGDCSSCAPSDSVMSLVPYEPNDPSTYNQAYGRATSPTACDNQNLQQTNYPTGSTGGGGGGGSTGCTNYYWLYYESYDGGQTWYLVDVQYAGCW